MLIRDLISTTTYAYPEVGIPGHIWDLVTDNMSQYRGYTSGVPRFFVPSRCFHQVNSSEEHWVYLLNKKVKVLRSEMY